MAADQGIVSEVSVEPSGDRLLRAQPPADLVLALNDAADFAEAGTLTIDTWSPIDNKTVSYDYDYVAVDYDADTVTLDAAGGGLVVATEPGDSVRVQPSAQTKMARVLLVDTDEAVTAEVPHNLSDLIGVGIRDEGEQETVAVELRGHTWYVVDVPGKSPAIRSTDWADGEAGWGFDDDNAQVDNLQVLDTLGADQLAAERFTMGGADLQTEVIDPISDGLLVYGDTRNMTVDTAAVSAETVMFRMNVGALAANRAYRIHFAGCLAVGTLVAGDVYSLRIRYTTDGTLPTATSSILDRSMTRVGITAATTQATFDHACFWLPGTDKDPVRFALTLARVAGSGTAAIICSDNNYGFGWAVEDLGAQATSEGPNVATAVLAQVSKSSGVADTPGPTRYKTTWWATGTASFDADSTRRAGTENTTDCYQGYFDSTHGDQRSLACFDDADIRARLAGAKITSVTLTYRVRHAYYATGLDVRVKAHNHSSPPGTYGGVGNLLASRDDCAEGATLSVALPTTFGDDLRTGLARGVAFYGPSNAHRYYGYLYGGATGGSRPRLTVVYSK